MWKIYFTNTKKVWHIKINSYKCIISSYKYITSNREWGFYLGTKLLDKAWTCNFQSFIIYV